MKFVDSAKVYLTSGKGGAGCASFRREKFIEFGGPNGGDGGRGGDVIIQGRANLTTLHDYKIHPHQKAKNGMPGEGSQRTGAKGADKIIPVPLGTIITNADTDEILLEILEEKDYVVLRGGKGGLGNIHFKTSTNRAPRYAQPGLPGEELTIRLELKLMADVGLVGFPNAGKSTLISSISKARPRVADYPFTTLVPNLGVVKMGTFQSFVVADIPGIIEDASEGVGLGHQFLKHIQRTAVLALLIDCSYLAEQHPTETYQILLKELEKFSEDLMDKERIVLLTKIDALSEDFDLDELKKEFEAKGEKVLAISSATKKGLEEVVQILSPLVIEARSQQETEKEEAKKAAASPIEK